MKLLPARSSVAIVCRLAIVLILAVGFFFGKVSLRQPDRPGTQAHEISSRSKAQCFGDKDWMMRQSATYEDIEHFLGGKTVTEPVRQQVLTAHAATAHKRALLVAPE